MLTFPSIRRVPCRHCGRLIVFNDFRLVISHEVPECDGFRAMMAQAATAGMGADSTSVEVLDDRGHFVAKIE
jgi:hypothetical protein